MSSSMAHFSLMSPGWRENQATAATPKAVEAFPALPQSFFARPAELVATDLIGCLLVKRQPSGELLWGVVVETEAYSKTTPLATATAAAHPATKHSLESQGVFMSM